MFNSSKYKLGARVGIELINPKGRFFYVVYSLKFRCTNNVVECEAFIHGLFFVIEKDVKALIIEGAS